jgi:Domain of unknown function (DUF1611_N) Rossmann-like domain
MSKLKTDLVQHFEKLSAPTPSQDAATMERLATHERGIPQQGWVKEAEAATERGRSIINSAHKGLASFPPARQLERDK